jgi:hypothetical protein
MNKVSHIKLNSLRAFSPLLIFTSAILIYPSDFCSVSCMNLTSMSLDFKFEFISEWLMYIYRAYARFIFINNLFNVNSGSFRLINLVWSVITLPVFPHDWRVAGATLYFSCPRHCLERILQKARRSRSCHTSPCRGLWCSLSPWLVPLTLRYVLGLSTPFSSIAFMHQSIYVIDASMISLSLYIHSITIMLTRMYQSVKKLDIAFGVFEHMIQLPNRRHVSWFFQRHSCELTVPDWAQVCIW